MKKLSIILLAMLILTALGGQCVVREIRAHDYDAAVTRVVIELSGVAEYKVTQGDKILTVDLFGADAGIAEPKYSRLSRILDAVSISQMGNNAQVSVSTMDPVRLESSTLSEPFRIILDLHAEFRVPNRKLQLKRAEFYAETGKLNSADNAFAELSGYYPKDSEILYKWGKLLVIREAKERALKKLKQIPASSAYYNPAQELISELSGTAKKVAKAPEPVKPKKPVVSPILGHAKADSVAQQDSSSSFLQTRQTPKNRTPKSEACSKSPGWRSGITNFVVAYCTWILTFLGLCLIVLIILIISGSKKQKPVKSSPESGIILGDDKKRKMVMQLVGDGWRPREIARELKIPLKEVECIINLCQTTGMEN